MSAVYSVGPPELVDPLIYDGFVEELVEVLEIKGADIMVSGGVSGRPGAGLWDSLYWTNITLG